MDTVDAQIALYSHIQLAHQAQNLIGTVVFIMNLVSDTARDSQANQIILY